MRVILTGRDRLALWLFVLPAVAIILFAQGYPLVYSLVVSFLSWSLANSDVPQGFVGLANYLQVLQDPAFQNACKISFEYMIVTTIAEVALGFIVGYVVVGHTPAIKVARTILIAPMVLAPVAVGIMFRMFLDAKYGLLNSVLGLFGISRPDWLGDPSFALWGAILMDIWQWTPFAMIIYVAAISGISESVIEAARIDGASPLRVITHVIWPLVWPATILILIFRMIDTFFVFDQIYTLTYGGPGTSTQVVSLYIYRQGLSYFNISQAAAASSLVMVVSVAIAVLLLNLKGRAERRLY
ncbi:MAG: sugar ABC transporter permease [Chloroflexi bacterium]|nr:sugar ABC transporter permease [Chloroflexota bacterium]